MRATSIAIVVLAAASVALARQPTPPLQRALECHGDNDCVINALRGNAVTDQEVTMLLVTYRLARRTAEGCAVARHYVQQFPTGQWVARYRQFVTEFCP